MLLIRFFPFLLYCYESAASIIILATVSYRILSSEDRSSIHDHTEVVDEVVTVIVGY